MGVLVVLVEGIRTPKYAVAVRAGIALVPLVKLVLVPFPIEFALKGNVAKGAPVSALWFGAPSAVAFGRRRRRRLGRCDNILEARPNSSPLR